MDDRRTLLLRELLAGTAWTEQTRAFAAALRTAGHDAGGLLIVGTPSREPWHMTAHLDGEARLSGLPELSPILIRHQVPDGAPPHLAVGLSRLEAARRGETVFVVAPGQAPEGLLSRVEDARHAGVTVLAMEAGDQELRRLAHEALTVTGRLPGPAAGPALASPAAALWRPAVLAADGVLIPHDLEAAFETAQHLVSLAAGETPVTADGRRGFRDRLSRFLDAVSGPAAARGHVT